MNYEKLRYKYIAQYFLRLTLNPTLNAHGLNFVLFSYAQEYM